MLQVLERSQEAMQGDAQAEPGGAAGGLAHLLLNSYQEHLIQNRLQEEQEREDGAQEEEEEDEEDDGKSSWWVSWSKKTPPPFSLCLLHSLFCRHLSPFVLLL